jgi:hypothetical protein
MQMRHFSHLAILALSTAGWAVSDEPPVAPPGSPLAVPT